MIKKLLKIILMKIISYFNNFILYFDKGEYYEDVFFISAGDNVKIFDQLAVFSHFDKDGFIDEYVIQYLTLLNKAKIDIVFVSTSENLNEEELIKISKFCRNIIVKNNIGYDFGSWKTGIKIIEGDLKHYKSLILCNDSVYMLKEINIMLELMKNQNLDFWGITDSYQYRYHIQSYFMFFNKKIFMTSSFIYFWKNIKSFKYKQNIIKNYELGLTKLIKNNNYKFASYCKSQNNSNYNITHTYWKKLIIDYKCPIIKIELLRDNPTNVTLDNWEKVLEKHTSYDIEIIKKHLARTRVHVK